jgi:malate dehydrogenase (oxaloacetate-decarboxylating)(NADP+)
MREREALEYHERPRPGKLEVVPTKPCTTQRDLALAYSAAPCTCCSTARRSRTS